MKPSEILKGALRKFTVHPESWGRGYSKFSDGSPALTAAAGDTVCILGALDLAGRSSLSCADGPLDFVTRALGFGSGTDVFDWNDSPHRTVEHVRSALKAAIALAESEGQ